MQNLGIRNLLKQISDNFKFLTVIFHFDIYILH